MWCIVASYVSTAITAWGGTSMTHETRCQIHPMALKIDIYQCERKITKSLKTHLFYLGLRSDIWYQKYLVLYPNNGIDDIKSNNHSPTDSPKSLSCLHTPTIRLHWLVKPSIISFLKDSSTTEAPTTSLYFSCPLSDVLSFQCLCCVPFLFLMQIDLCCVIVH